MIALFLIFLNLDSLINCEIKKAFGDNYIAEIENKNTLKFDSIAILNLPQKLSENLIIPVLASVDTLTQKLFINIRVEKEAEVPLALRDIKRGEIIKEGDYKIVHKKIPIYLNVKENICGMRVKRLIRAGEIITIKDIEKPPIVKYGDLVTVILKEGSLRVSTRGRAMRDGWEGDIIPVRLYNGKILQGKVLPNGKIILM